MKKYIKNIRGYVVLSILFSIFEAIITSITLLFPGWLIDNHAKGLSYVTKLTILYVGCFAIYLVIAYCSNRISDFRRVKFEKSIKKDFFDSIISRNYLNYHEYDTAEYISMQANDITEMCQNYLSPLLSIYRSVILIVAFGISLVVFVNYYIALVIFFFSVIVVFIPKITSEKLSGTNKVYLDAVGKYTAKVSKLLEAHDILDSRGKSKVKQIHNEEIDNVLKLNMKFRKINSLAMVINGGSVEFVSVITFIIVAILLINGKITVGMATIAFTYSTRFMEPIYELNVCIGKVNSVKKIQNKLMNIINYKTSCNDTEPLNIKKITTSELKKKYQQKELLFPYTTFLFPKKYLITGENGVGKSVFLRLIMQFEKADLGEITYDDEIPVNIAEDMFYIPQNPIIFKASYKDNLTIFNAYDDSNISLYESYFPNEVISNIKRNGELKNLSGGEKQVIGLIRALCSEKRIIIMDEPFSAMNQVMIDCFMKHMSEINRMIIIVAHNVDEYTELFDKKIHISQ